VSRFELPQESAACRALRDEPVREVRLSQLVTESERPEGRGDFMPRRSYE
jgi:hypothetical protein